MIHRQNWLDVRAYLHHLDRNLGRDPETIRKYRGQLRHLLEWADATPFPRVRHVDPTFPVYMVAARNDHKDQRLSYTSIYKTLTTVRTFFQYARLQWTQRYRPISESWIEFLQPSRESKPRPRLQEHQFYSLATIRTLLAVSVETLHDARAQVAVAMLFCSGMRADTLASLPIHCVDVSLRRILQWPELGVRTKNDKAATTYLLEIPDLLALIADWHARLAAFPPQALWYATLNNDGTQLTATTHAIKGRSSVIGDDIRMLCAKAGVEYLSPHKLRHGHVVYGLQNARDMADLKAISQNVMHASLTITDQVYGNFRTADVGRLISTLGQPHSNASLEDKVTELLEMLKNRSLPTDH